MFGLWFTFQLAKKMGEKLDASKILQRKMQEKQKINIVWFRNDVRTTDNPSLYQASREELPFLAVYVLDTDFLKKMQFGFQKIGKFRAKFLVESLENLKNNLEKLEIPFFFKCGTTQEVFKNLALQFDVHKIFLQHEWTAEEKLQEENISLLFPKTKMVHSYGQFLVEPPFVKALFRKIPDVFTHFRKLVESQLTIREEWNSSKNPKQEKTPFQHLKSDEISLEKLGFEAFENHPNSAFPFSGGESAAWERLNSYFFDQQFLKNYKETRNGLIGANYSSKFSAWLANGSISAVSIYHQIKKFETEFGANESTYWLFFELLWRDYFKYISLEHGNEIFKKNGINNKFENHQKNDKKTINAWVNGKTNSDFVNANMIELKNTGFMSNRGRQNVASYFCKTLQQDWRMGAAYFEKMLIDYDVHSNYGNWMYVSGVGNDPRNRTFNPEKQAEMYDKEGNYRKLWNPK